MANFNRVILVGKITREIELRRVSSGSAVAKIGLAVNRAWVKDGQRQEEVTFVDVTLWGRTAEVAEEFLSKGSPVLIEGRLHLDQWTDTETGKKRSKLSVVGESLQFLEGKREDKPLEHKPLEHPETPF